MLKNSKIFRLLVIFVFLFITLFSNNMAMPVQAYSDVSTMTDQDFFGVWDNNQSIWTNPGKLNYDGFPDLATVKNDVINTGLSGNYTQAKTDLLTYFKNRTSRTMPAYYPTTPTDELMALLEADDFYYTGGVGGEYPLAVSTFTTTPATVSTTVTDGVNEALAQTGYISFMLMARTHSSNGVNINSNNNASNKPQLDVTLTGGTQQTFYPTKDTYIQAGTNGNTNYGSDQYLVVKEEGSPTTDNTRRSYVDFDLSSLGVSSIQSAVLKLYGSSNSSTMDVVVNKCGETGLVENTMTWNNTIHWTFSWTGVSGGTDWNKPPYSQSEFHYSTCRFDFADEVMATYLKTNNEYYANNLIRIWMDFITDKGNANPLYTRTLDTGVRAIYMVPAYHTLKNSTSIDAGANAAMLKFFWQMGNVLSLPANFDPTSNWGQTCTRGLYEISVYFPEFTATAGDTGWLQTTKNRFDTLMSGLVFWDGAYKEATTHYTRGTANSYNEIKKIAFVNNDTLSTDFDLKLQQLGEYVMDFTRPDGNEVPFGDSDPVETASLAYEIGQNYPARQDLLYGGSFGAEGDVPGHTSSFYEAGLTAFMKTGYTANDMFMSIDMNEGPHSHPDLNTVTAYAYNQDLLVDPGKYSYNNDTVTKWLRTKTVSHNTIEVDGQAQNSASATRNIGIWSTNNTFDFYEGDAAGAYTGIDHFRDVLFLRNKFWIVSDYVTSSSGTHNYNQTWHFLPAAGITIPDANAKKIKTNFTSNGNIQVVPADPANVTASLPSGYYSPRSGVYATALYGSYLKSSITGNTTFDTVLYPTQAGDNRDVRVTRLTTSPSVPTTTATALKIDHSYGASGNLGYYYLSHESVNPTTARSFDTYNYNGKAAYIETTSGGSYVMAAVKTGKVLKNGSTNIISSTSTINDMGVKWNGTTLEINGTGLVPDTSTSTAVAIYAPSATSVTLNGSTVTFTKSGNYIYAARAVKGYNPYCDAYVQGGTYANTNLAFRDSLTIKRSSSASSERHAYLMFHFTGSHTTAKLRMFVKGVDVDASRTIKIYGMAEADTDWWEETITYNNAPPKGTYITSWTITLADEGKWFEADVSSYISGITGQWASFYLANEGTSSGGNTMEFYSTDSTINKPVLYIN